MCETQFDLHLAPMNMCSMTCCTCCRRSGTTKIVVVFKMGCENDGIHLGGSGGGDGGGGVGGGYQSGLLRCVFEEGWLRK